MLGTLPAHATRVTPGGRLRSAVNRLRLAGTLPPAAGLDEKSARGSGQYDARSMCADAVVAPTTIAATSSTAAARPLHTLATGPV